MDAAPGPSLAVNGVVADFAAETLRDRAGNPVALRPQAFAVLRYLAEHPGRLVSKDELMAAVWPGVAVTDDSLVQCIHDIRRAIGDEAHAVLKTVPRRGYKLALPAAGATVAARWPRGRALAAGLATALVIGVAGAWWLARPEAPGGVPLVAVLPFEAVSDDESARLLARGLTEDVITDLGRIPEFAVLASGAIAGYRGGDADPRKVGAELGAAFVVEGSIARDADRARVTAQLIDARTGGSLWSDRWDRPAADLFAVQTEIAETIANRLGGGAGLVQEAGRIAARRKPPGDLGAYELYLLGTEKLEQVTRADIDEAVRLLGRAVAIDPGFARAWIELSHSHGLLAWNFGVEPERNMAAGRAAAERALALDPGDSEAHIAVGKMAAFEGDQARTKAAFDTALQLAPNAAEILTFYAGYASGFGEAERGAEVADRAIQLEPNFPRWKIGMYAYAYFMAGRYEDTLAMIARQSEADYYKDTWALRAGALAALGREAEARAVSAKAAAARPDVTIESLLNDPMYIDAERRRLVDTLRPAGFAACALPEALAGIAAPRRLPECEGRAEAAAPGIESP
jgi:TolB-like protein/DNA-binding winged helix-turn-helix (wHTH) protein/tetratricopeptide (TPR) repeat protein